MCCCFYLASRFPSSWIHITTIPLGQGSHEDAGGVPDVGHDQNGPEWAIMTFSSGSGFPGINIRGARSKVGFQGHKGRVQGHQYDPKTPAAP